MFKPFIPAGAALAAILATAGCSSSNNGSDDAQEETTNTGTESIEGRAADGYLAGARVCLDLNSNSACDDDEPSSTTANGGAYTLDGVTQAQIDNSPIVVEIIVGETIDEDQPGVVIEKTYTLTAPAGSAFVSPLTTMVQNEIKEKGLTPEEAKASVQTKLGTDLDPTGDYVAGSDDETSGAEFERLHKVAQVTRAVMQKNIELVDTVVGETGVSMEDLTALIIEQVINALDDIQQAVNDSGSDFNPDDLAGSDELEGTRLDPTTVEDELQAREDRKNASAANLSTLLTSGGGLNFFESDEDEGEIMFYYGNVLADGEGAITITQFGFDGESSWVENDDDNSQDQNCFLANATWNCLADNDENITTEGNNVRILYGDLTATEELISGVEVNLVGKRIVTYLEPSYHAVVDPSAVFETGATGYQLTFTRTNNIYEVYKDNVEEVSECWGGNFNEDNTWAPTDVWCNNVFVRTGDGNHETDGDAATSLSQLISATAASNPSSRADIGGVNIHGNDIEWSVELVQGGNANIYKVEYSESSESVKKVATATWTQETIDTKSLILLKLPANIAFQGGYDQGEVQMYTVVDGYVRHGEMIPAGARGDRQWVLNGAGRDQIKAAFDYSLLDSLDACDVEENEDSTISDFDTIATTCSTTSFISSDVAGKAFALRDGAFSFTQDGNGVYQGEIDDGDFVSLGFTWAIDGDGYIEINTQHTDDGVTEFLRMNLAKVEVNARQMSVVTFGQDSESSSTLGASTGEVRGEVWNVR